MSNSRKKASEITPWELPSLPTVSMVYDSETLREITRRDYREPIGDSEELYVEIEGTALPVFDIGSFGIGIIVPSLDYFTSGAVHEMTLHIGASSLAMKSLISHISPSDSSGKCHCGLEFINLSQKEEHTLQRFLADHHARLFSRQPEAGKAPSRKRTSKQTKGSKKK